MGIEAIEAAGGFFSAWLTMIFRGVVAPDFDVRTISYPTAMLMMIAVWLVVAPLAAAGRATKKGG